MVQSVETPVLQTVIHQSVMRTQAIVTLAALLVSLVISAINHVLLTVKVAVIKSVVLVQSVKKASLVGYVANHVM